MPPPAEPRTILVRAGRALALLAGLALIVSFLGPWGSGGSGLDAALEVRERPSAVVLWLLPVAALGVVLSFGAGSNSLGGAALVGGVATLLVMIVPLGLAMSWHFQVGAWMVIAGGALAIAAGAAPRVRILGLPAGALIVVGFFLPWLGEGFFEVTGRGIANNPGGSTPWLYAVLGCGALAPLTLASPRVGPVGVVAGVGAVLAPFSAFIVPSAGSFRWGFVGTMAAAVALLGLGVALGGGAAPARKAAAPRSARPRSTPLA